MPLGECQCHNFLRFRHADVEWEGLADAAARESALFGSRVAAKIRLEETARRSETDLGTKQSYANTFGQLRSASGL